MELNDGEVGQKFPHCTMEEIVNVALELRSITADDQWISTENGRAEIRDGINRITMAIIHLPMRPASKDLSLAYRFARAEAERLNLSCLVFERVMRPSIGNVSPLTETEQLGLALATEQLHAALGAFAAIAQDL